MNQLLRLIKKNGLGMICNSLVGLVGIILILVGLLVSEENLKVILISVGASLLATAIATFLTSFYIIHASNVKTMIDYWGLQALYQTKAEMNEEANVCLEKCRSSIDIIAIGMKNYISVKGKQLQDKIAQGVKVRIISCVSDTDMLTRREIDETIEGRGSSTGSLSESVKNLTAWVQNVQGNEKGGSIEIKYHDSYPAFSYLKIDNKIFFSSNLWMKPSQQNMAWVFSKNGRGYEYYNSYFDELWCNENFCKLDGVGVSILERNKVDEKAEKEKKN